MPPVEPAERNASAVLLTLTAQVRSLGTVLFSDTPLQSEAILPAGDIDLGKMQKLVGSERLVPG